MLQPERYDLVFTGIGALCWLPDVKRWAGVVAGLLRPGGRLFIREGHPMLWAIDESQTDALVVGYPYFEEADPIIDDEGGTYVATDVEFTHNVSHSWNHGIGEIITALMDAGMELTGFVEHDSVPWEALPGQMEKDDAGRVATDRSAVATRALVHPPGDEERVIRRRKGLPGHWERIAAAQLGAWNGFDAGEREQLGALGDWLLRHKNWEAAHGFELDDVIRRRSRSKRRCSILALDTGYYREVSAIIVYPTTILSRGERGTRPRHGDRRRRRGVR